LKPRRGTTIDRDAENGRAQVSHYDYPFGEIHWNPKTERWIFSTPFCTAALAARKAMATNNIFSPFLDSTSNTSTTSGRANPLGGQQQQQSTNANGNGAIINGLPMIAGQQMDVNFLYQKVVELSEVLRDNREKVQGIVAGAEELAVCGRHVPSIELQSSQSC